MTINIQNSAEINKLHTAISLFSEDCKALHLQIFRYLDQQQVTLRAMPQVYQKTMETDAQEWRNSERIAKENKENLDIHSVYLRVIEAKRITYLKAQHKCEAAHQILNNFERNVRSTQPNADKIFKDLVREAEKSMKVLEAILKGVTDFREVKLSETTANVVPNPENQATAEDMHQSFVKKKETAYLDGTDLKDEASLKMAESKWIARGQSKVHVWANNKTERALLSANGYECQGETSEFIKSFVKK